MGLSASRLNLRLFIDGMEVPVTGARCTFPDGGPATAEVQVIATDQVYDLPPRSLVTLFYYDNRPYTGDNQGGTLRYYPVGPQDLRRWKLLYMGEIVGVSFQKQDSQRAAMIHCIDFTSYWDFLKQHYVNFSNGGVELFENAFLGVRMDRIQNFDVVTKDMQSNLLTTLLKATTPVSRTVTTPATAAVPEKRVRGQVSVAAVAAKPATTKTVTENVPSLYLGVHRLLREIFFASNIFYARAFNRLRMNDLIVGLKEDTTAAKLFRLQYFQKFIQNQIGGGGGMVTGRQMVDTLLGSVFHNYTTMPCPFFDTTGASRGFDPDVNKDTISSEIIDRDAYKGATLNYTVIKPDTSFFVPPVCNLVFPHQYNSISYQRNYLSEPTRLFMRTSLFFGGNDKWLTERFYAPDFEAFNEFLHRKGGYLARMSQVLLPHELQVGINPIMGWQPDIGAYVAKGPRREYLSQVADYEFWKARFAQRSLNVGGPFNPEVIPGYPGVVMDRVGAGSETNRHFIGQVATVTHALDQSGGWTYLTMTQARVHDEDIDFDGKGRSIEEITSRGTDGFLDDRYDLTKIGESVYKPLFGCGSFTDAFNADNMDSGTFDTESIKKIKDLSEKRGPMVGAVAVAEAYYRSVASSGSDPDSFAWTTCRRPKADLTQILGVPPGEGDSLLADVTFIGSGGTDKAQGFMGVAVDVDAADMAKDSYKSMTKTTVQVGTRHTDAIMTSVTDSLTGEVRDEEEVPASDTPIMVQTYKEGTAQSYELKASLEKRQAAVKGYLDSLKYRGIRG